jgi:hypothetical protein
MDTSNVSLDLVKVIDISEVMTRLTTNCQPGLVPNACCPYTYWLVCKQPVAILCQSRISSKYLFLFIHHKPAKFIACKHFFAERHDEHNAKSISAHQTSHTYAAV